MKKHYAYLLTLFLFASMGHAQTVGLLQHDPESLDDGYILFSPLLNKTTYLIDKCGRQVKTWESAYNPGCSNYILPDGTLLRAGNVNNPIFTAGGTGGIIEKIDWEGNVVWSYTVSDNIKCQHHDVKALPNGNILLIAWESKTQEEAIAAGRIPAQVGATLWSEQILEIQPVGATGGNVVWEWHLWDHLVQDFDNTKSNYNSVVDHPELFNVNYNSSADQADWIHLNSIDYNPVLDQIVLSSFTAGEIWIIDHSTTTAEAATHAGGNSGKGGDLLYRLGNPATYNAPIDGTILFNGQHNAHWITDGLPFANQIIVHNNGNGRIGGNYSSVEIINPPLSGFTYATALPILPTASSWSYNNGNPNNYYAPFISGAEQLPNGNVLICGGVAGVLFEVTPAGETVWKYVNPENNLGLVAQGDTPINTFVFRCSYYPFDYSGFDGHTLTPGNIIENANAVSDNCTLNLAVAQVGGTNGVVAYPNPSRGMLNVKLPNHLAQGNLVLINGMGQKVYETAIASNVVSVDTNAFASGLYYLTINAGTQQFKQKVIVE